MYCLDCGTKLEKGQQACPKCGLSLADMQERLACAEEMLIYSDSVNPHPGETTKLPPVSQRTYTDARGNALNPADEISRESLHNHTSPTPELPRIGTDDPYVTMPIQRVVNEYNQVIADRDNNQKVYRQREETKRNWLPLKILCAIAILAAVVIGAYYGYAWYNEEHAAQVALQQQEEEQRAAEEAQTQSEQRALGVYQELSTTYGAAKASYDEVENLVDAFEGAYLVSNKDTRQAKADECQKKLDDLNQVKSNLATYMGKMNVVEGDPYYGQYQKIDQLYDDLIARTSVINACWQISLQYDDPKNHQSEILKPLSQDLDHGKSASMADFRANVDAAEPEYLEADK